MSGQLQIGVIVRGCLEDSEIWTASGKKLEPVFQQNLSTQNSLYKEFLLPLTEMNNPFLKENSNHLFFIIKPLFYYNLNLFNEA